MELHERLSTVRPAPIPIGRDPFAEVKNRIHLAVIGELGPQLFNVSMDPNALRERVADDIKTHLGDEQGLSRDDRDRIAAEIAEDALAFHIYWLRRIARSRSFLLVPGRPPLNRMAEAAAAASSRRPPSSGDTIAPTTPSNMTTLLSGTTRVAIDFVQLDRQRGVTGYPVYRDGTLVATSPTSWFVDSGLGASTTHTCPDPRDRRQRKSLRRHDHALGHDDRLRHRHDRHAVRGRVQRERRRDLERGRQGERRDQSIRTNQNGVWTFQLLRARQLRRHGDVDKLPRRSTMTAVGKQTVIAGRRGSPHAALARRDHVEGRHSGVTAVSQDAAPVELAARKGLNTAHSRERR